jgi:hypothetical protein
MYGADLRANNSLEILVRTMAIGNVGENGLTEDTGIKTVADLRRYFTMFKRRGELFGYVVDKRRKPAWNDDKIISVEVIIEYTDKAGLTRLGFERSETFIAFLNTHPEIAKCFEYVKKN